MSRRGPDDRPADQPAAQLTAQLTAQTAQPDRAERRDRLETWERLEQPLLAALPYFALALSVIVVITVGTGSAAALLVDLALAAAAAAWMLWLYTLHPAWRERQPVVSLFLAGLIVLMAAMVLRDPYFGIFTWTGYLYVYLLPLGRWRLLAAAAVAVIAATSQDGGLPTHTTAGLVTFAVLVSFNVLAGCGFTWFASISHERDDRRKQLVTQLSEANRKLEATLAENAGLHQQLIAQAREAGILDERQRMAREIHDTLAQGLTGIVTQLQAAEQAARAADHARHLESAIRLARDSLSEARRSVHELRPEPLETARLGEALTAVARHWSDLHGVPARLTTTGNPRPMRPDVEVTLLRAARRRWPTWPSTPARPGSG